MNYKNVKRHYNTEERTFSPPENPQNSPQNQYNFPPNQQNSSNFQQDKAFYQNCDIHHKNDKKSVETFKIGSSSQKTPPSEADQNFCNPPNDAICYQKKSAISFLGSLPESLLGGNLTPTKKVFLGNLIRLCNGNFGRKHRYSINVPNKKIAEWCEGSFSVRQIQRHIDDLAASRLIFVTQKNGERWISARAVTGGKSVPLISAGPETSHAQDLLLSVLLNKGAYSARGDTNFHIDTLTVDQLEHELFPLTGKTIKNGLKKLAEMGFIYIKQHSKGKRNKKISISFSMELEFAYRDLITIKRSEKCEQIAYNRAVGRVLANADPKLKAMVKEDQQNRARLKAGMAEVPSMKAETFEDVLVRQNKHQLWQQAVSRSTGGEACDPRQKFMELSRSQIRMILSFPAALVWETKGTSHNDFSETKGVSHQFFGKQKTSHPCANPHSNAVFGAPINNRSINKKEILTRRAGGATPRTTKL